MALIRSTQLQNAADHKSEKNSINQIRIVSHLSKTSEMLSQTDQRDAHFRTPKKLI
jgi:hypothetical protein